MKKLIYCMMLLLPLLSWAQERIITGKVYDTQYQEPLLGATVVNKTKNTATTTEMDGSYSLVASTGDTLVISYIGYITQSIIVATANVIDVNLVEDVAALDEVVVIGYGTQAVRELTGAVSIVKAETIEALKPVRIEQALQGQVPGVAVTSTGGAPGAALNIRIRGISTNGDSRPLILVDGNVIEDLSVINPGDIESFSVLKDATAGIYGVRAANGVIIITTKSGRKNQSLQVEYNTYAGWQETTRKLPVLNSQEYALLANEAFANNGEALPFTDLSTLSDTNYQDELFDSAFTMNHDISLRGGTEKSVYAAGMSYLTQDGILSTSRSNFDRFTFRGNFDHNWTDNLKMKTGVLYSWTGTKNFNDNGLGSVLFNAINMAPTIPVRDENGDFSLAEGLGNEVINPVAQLENTFNRNYVGKISGNFGLTYGFLEDFEATARIQVNYARAHGRNFSPRAFYGSGKVFNLNENVYGTYSNYFRDYTYDAFLKYSKTFADRHNLEATIGMSAFRTTGKFNGFTGFNNESNNFFEASIQGAERREDNFRNGGDRFDSRLLSHFARVQYNYDGKYLFSGVIRRDGSTAFGPENKFGIFPSGSIGWVASDEEFLKDSDFVNFFKVRASAGLLGNDRIGAFGFVSSLNGEGEYVFNDQLVLGSAVGRPGNPEIQWEEQFTTNVGVDMNFLNNKLSITADYFVRETRELLFSPPISSLVGSTAPGAVPSIINGGDIRNSGFEFQIGYADSFGDDFSFSASYNLGTVDNEVLSVNNSNGFFEGGGFGVGQPPITRFEAGQPLGYFYGFVTDGIFQTPAEVAAHPSQLALGANAQPGDIRYRDINGDGVIDLDDRANLGDAIADVTMGLNLTFNYKNWDFQTYLYASIGNDMVRNYERDIPLTNRTINRLDRWTGPGTSNTNPRVTTGATSNNVFSDFFVEDASFLRAQNVQLGYTFDNDQLYGLKVSSLRFYGSVNNLFTLTEYRGFDPSATSGGALDNGIDNGFYPVPRTFLFGINAKF
ncbi:MAG: TonB-dependent receptor [Nonlabens sp.]